MGGNQSYRLHCRPGHARGCHLNDDIAFESRERADARAGVTHVDDVDYAMMAKSVNLALLNGRERASGKR